MITQKINIGKGTDNDFDKKIEAKAIVRVTFLLITSILLRLPITHVFYVTCHCLETTIFVFKRK